MFFEKIIYKDLFYSYLSYFFNINIYFLIIPLSIVDYKTSNILLKNMNKGLINSWSYPHPYIYLIYLYKKIFKLKKK